MRFKYFSQEGDSLLEIIVAFAVVTLVLVALISAVTVSLANAQYARNKAQATKYGQEAIEWLRGQRDTLGWANFYAKDPTSQTTKIGTTYCVNNITIFPSLSGTCTLGTVITGTLFKREAKLTGNGGAPNNNDKVTINVKVSWTQGSRTSEINLDTVLTKW